MYNTPPSGGSIKHTVTTPPLNTGHRLRYGHVLRQIRDLLYKRPLSPEINEFLAEAMVEGSFLNLITVVEDMNICGYVTSPNVSTFDLQKLIGAEASHRLDKIFVRDLSSKTGWRVMNDRSTTVSNADSFFNIDNRL